MPALPAPLEAQFTLLRSRARGRRARSTQRYAYPLATSGRVTFPATGRTVYAWVTDFSAGGLAFTLPVPLEVGTEFHVHLKMPAQEEGLARLAHVVRTTAEDDDCWRIGCAFVEPLPAGLLEALLP